MIITISGANFSASNIGTLDSWMVSTYGIGKGATHSIPSTVKKGDPFNYTITIKDGYEFGTYSITMGGQTITPTVTATTITINIASVTGAIVITVPTINISTGEEEGGNTGGDNEGGTLITSGSLTGAYLHENSQFAGGSTPTTGIIPDPNNVYFIIRDIPVMGNTKYRLAKGRACWYLNSNKEPLHTKYVNLTSEVTNFEFTTPANCAYLRVAFKYVEIQPSAVTITKYAFGEGVSTYIKDTTAEYRDEYAVEKGKTEPTPYTGYFIWHNIPVTGGNKYQIVNARLSLWYDADKNYVSQVNFNANSVGATTSDWSHVAPDNAAYLTICVNKNDAGKDDIVMVEYPAI